MAAHCACAHWHVPHARFTITHNFPQTLAFRPTIDTRPQQPPCIPQTLRGREGRWIFRASSAEHRRRIQRIPCCFLGFSLLLSSALSPSFTSSPSTRHSSAHITIRACSSVCPTQARRVPTRSSTSTWIRWTPSFARVFRPTAAVLAPHFHVLFMLSHHRENVHACIPASICTSTRLPQHVPPCACSRIPTRIARVHGASSPALAPNEKWRLRRGRNTLQLSIMLSASHRRIAICTLSSPPVRRNAQTFTCAP